MGWGGVVGGVEVGDGGSEEMSMASGVFGRRRLGKGPLICAGECPNISGGNLSFSEPSELSTSISSR